MKKQIFTLTIQPSEQQQAELNYFLKFRSATLRRILMFLMLASLMPTALSAHDFEVNGIYYLKNSDGNSVSVTYRGSSYNSYSNEYTGDIVIPPSVTYDKTYSVTSIGSTAFAECVGLSTITIPHSVTSIGNYAFYGCSNLTGSLIIPNSVTSIGNYAFYGCSNLTGSLIIPDSVTEIGDYAFVGLSGLTSVTIGNSVTSIGNFTFYGCAGLTGSLTIPDSVTEIGDYAFVGLSGLTSVTIGNSVTSIGKSAFDWCRGLTGTLIIPNSVTSIGERAFAVCEGLTSVTIGNSVISIGSEAFYWCDGLTGSLIIPNSVTSIGEKAFYSCIGLTSMTIGNSVTSIGNHAFDSCMSLTSLTIPNSVTEIGEYAFWGCGGLTSIVVESGNKKYDSRDNCNAIVNTSNNELVVGCENTVIPNSVISIGSEAFYGCDGLTSVTIPNSVTCIGGSAFESCSGLTSVSIGNSVTKIDGNPFSFCSQLTSIVVESGNSTYDSRGNCNAIIETESNALIAGCKNTIIPNSTTSIYPWAFAGCRGLTSLTIPNSVISIDQNAFNRCTSLKSVTIPNSVTSIGDYAFYGCRGLTSVTVPNTVKEIGSGAFSKCDGLADVWNYSQTPQAIDDNTFSVFNKLHVPKSAVGAYTAADVWKEFEVIGFDPYGETLTFDKDAPTHDAVVIGFDNSTPDVVIPETITVEGVEYEVTGVADEAFRNCYNLKSIEIPATVRELGESAFQGCSSLERVVLPDLCTPAAAPKHLSTKAASTNLLIIDDYAFADCSTLNEVRNNSLAPQAVNETVFSGVDVSNCKLYVPEQSMNLYKDAAIWKGFIIEGFVGVEDIFIDRPNADKVVIGYYDLRGILHDKPVRGQVNIVRYSDGTAKKVVVE